VRRSILCIFLLFSIKISVAQKATPKVPFYPEESVDFSLKYSIFKIGEAHLVFSLNQNCLGANIIAYAESSGLMKFFKDIFFKYECCMDTVTGLPSSDSRILIEGDYIDISTVYYDHLSRNDSSLIYSLKTDTVVVPKNIYDLLSGFYRYRANYLGDNVPLDYSVSTTTFFIDNVWDLTIRYCGKDTIDTKYGSIECLKVKPVTIIGHFFRTTDAITIWFANDRYYMPVKFSIDLKLGTLVGSISDYKRTSLSYNME
jgi:hypothetical protein